MLRWSRKRVVVLQSIQLLKFRLLCPQTIFTLIIWWSVISPVKCRWMKSEQDQINQRFLLENVENHSNNKKPGFLGTFFSRDRHRKWNKLQGEGSSPGQQDLPFESRKKKKGSGQKRGRSYYAVKYCLNSSLEFYREWHQLSTDLALGVTSSKVDPCSCDLPSLLESLKICSEW